MKLVTDESIGKHLMLPLYQKIALDGLKRKELQVLCKKHDIKCSGKVAKQVVIDNNLECGAH